MTFVAHTKSSGVMVTSFSGLSVPSAGGAAPSSSFLLLPVLPPCSLCRIGLRPPLRRSRTCQSYASFSLHEVCDWQLVALLDPGPVGPVNSKGHVAPV
jgi:hypothetical protein